MIPQSDGINFILRAVQRLPHNRKNMPSNFHPLAIMNHGNAQCGHIAVLVQVLLEAVQVPTRILHLRAESGKGHLINEFFYGYQWLLADVDFWKDGQILGHKNNYITLNELRKDLTILHNFKPGPHLEDGRDGYAIYEPLIMGTTSHYFFTGDPTGHGIPWSV